MYDGTCELVLESSDLGTLERFFRRLGLDMLACGDDRAWLAAGNRSIYFSDPLGNRVALWDVFRDGDGDDAGVDALAQGPAAR